MSSLVPWLSVLAIAGGAFLVGKYFQWEERKQRELRKKQMVTTFNSLNDFFSATQPIRQTQTQPIRQTQTQEGLGSVQEQTQGQRYPN
jgi:hypothetical protein